MPRSYSPTLVSFSHLLERDEADPIELEVALEVTRGRNGPDGFYWDPSLGNFNCDDPGEIELIEAKDGEGKTIILTPSEEQTIIEAYESSHL